jgi:8-oxo-dGTP pyrophosphatase MutT (NUDIX family)
MNRQTVTAALSSFTPTPVPLDGRRAAAVAIPLGTRRGQTVVCLTERSSRLRAHPGQYAFPGGRIDAGESAPRAALRELHEELGIEAADGDVLGRLDDFGTRSGYVISPFVVWIGAQVEALRPNPDEVARVFTVTVDEVNVDPVYVDDPAVDAPILQWWFRGEPIHAPTAAILFQFREIALHHRHTPVAHVGQPVFAWQ